jgi:hypothetical protein
MGYRLSGPIWPSFSEMKVQERAGARERHPVGQQLPADERPAGDEAGGRDRPNIFFVDPHFLPVTTKIRKKNR